MAAADKERVAKLEADMPAGPKQAKASATQEAKAASKEAKASKVPRAKTAYLVSRYFLSAALSHLPRSVSLIWCEADPSCTHSPVL